MHNVTKHEKAPSRHSNHRHRLQSVYLTPEHTTLHHTVPPYHHHTQGILYISIHTPVSRSVVRMTTVLEAMMTAPSGDRWLEAHNDPLANIYTFSSCVALSDLRCRYVHLHLQLSNYLQLSITIYNYLQR